MCYKFNKWLVKMKRLWKLFLNNYLWGRKYSQPPFDMVTYKKLPYIRLISFNNTKAEQIKR